MSISKVGDGSGPASDGLVHDGNIDLTQPIAFIVPLAPSAVGMLSPLVGPLVEPLTGRRSFGKEALPADGYGFPRPTVD